MDIQKQHPEQEGDALPAARADGAPASPGRRRFTRAGLGASGVILTLASDPALATTATPFMCRSPSGSLSGGLQSQHGTQTVTCNGLSPGYWINHPEDWPASIYPVSTRQHNATMYASMFPFGSTTLYKTGTMMGVLTSNDSGQDPYNLGMHLVAAYLNVRSGKINYLTVNVLKTMWHDLVTYGYYAPMAGTKWYGEDIKNYLQSTEH